MNPDAFFVLGATHHTAPLTVRERLSVKPETIRALTAQLAATAGLKEFTLLNTCNRVEFYGVATHRNTAAEVEATFCLHQQFDREEFAQFRLSLRGPDALRHLLEVAAGIDSQMLGETEILGQVKEAYAAAQALGYTGAVLNRVFQKAFQAAKYVRTHTAITEGKVSVANVAVDLAQTIFGPLTKTRILLLGAGEIGEKTAKAFQSRGAGSLTIASRSFERAMQLATTLHGSAMPFEQREARLFEFDVVVCSTSAPGTVVSAKAVATAMDKRPTKPLFFIDLALPRDVEAAAAKEQNVFVYNLDDLAKIADENRAAREAEIERCRTLLAERLNNLWRDVFPRLEQWSAVPSQSIIAAPVPAPRP